MKQFRVSFPGHKIPAFTVWAHSYHPDREGRIQFWNEGHDGHKMEPVIRLSKNPPVNIQEVKNVSDDDT